MFAVFRVRLNGFTIVCSGLGIRSIAPTLGTDEEIVTSASTLKAGEILRSRFADWETLNIVRNTKP